MDMKYHVVQFVGGHADGVEMAVETLKPEHQWTLAPDWSELRGKEKDPTIVSLKIEVYVQIPDTTIYVFKKAITL